MGCGDVGVRIAALAGARWRVVGTARRPDQAARIRAAGARALAIDLDDRRSVARLAGLRARVIDLAPPPAAGDDDPRTRRLLAALATGGSRGRARWVYVSTTGVYGDAGGAAFDETRPVAPSSDRARRRVAAEHRMRAAGRRGQARVTILRVPGIYAHDRLPLARLREGTAALVDDDDVHTNHIHAEDLARACLAALVRGRPSRVVHTVDDSGMKMGEYFDAVADRFGLPRPPRLSRAEIARRVTPAMLSFMSESRRLANRRLKTELRLRLRWPTVAATLADPRLGLPGAGALLR